MSLGRGGGPDDQLRLADLPGSRPITARELAFEGQVWNVVTEGVELTPGETVRRDFVAHPGAVAVMAIDDQGRVLLLRQYRHPVRSELWEPPAGLLDVANESPQAAAARELFEEADLEAAEWHLLLDLFTTPGGSSEAIRFFVARGLSAVPVERRFAREAEERDMPQVWVGIDEAVAGVLAGRLGSPTTVAGVLALDAAQRAGWQTLRDAQEPWVRS